MMNSPRPNINRLNRLRGALYDYHPGALSKAIAELVSPEAICHFCHPLGDVRGGALMEQIYIPLARAMPDVERRDVIAISGEDEGDMQWIGCAGHYIGRFIAPFLDIPPTNHLAHLRYHEFFRFEDGMITEIQALWDVPELMLQSGVWPMGPALGREFFVPGPATQDGLSRPAPKEGQSAASRKKIIAMLTAMSRHPLSGGPEIMELDKFWHPRFNWYGPAGIGSMRGQADFRDRHQIPFLTAMPDRGQHQQQTNPHFFAEGHYVGATGWPTMCQTLTGDGWLGIVANGQKITLRSLDFWRLEDGLIRENWVLVDLLDMWNQLGVDVLARMRSLAAFRPPSYRAMQEN